MTGHAHDETPPLVVTRVVDNHPRHHGDYTHTVTIHPSTLEWRALLADVAATIVRRYGGTGILGKLLAAGKPGRDESDVTRFVSALNAPRWNVTLSAEQAADLADELLEAADEVAMCTCGRAVDVLASDQCGQCIDRRDFRVLPGGA